jgi:hypothetical protein
MPPILPKIKRDRKYRRIGEKHFILQPMATRKASLQSAKEKICCLLTGRQTAAKPFAGKREGLHGAMCQTT